jgi:Kef-type K+ transport system membrane component KefB
VGDSDTVRPETLLTDGSLLGDLGIMILGAAACVFVARRFNIPSIIAYIASGLLLGPVLGLVSVTKGVEVISEIGIALLLFLVGLELSLDKIRDVGKVAVVAGIGQVLFTAAGGVAFCLLLGFDAIESIFIATALTFSSTVVVVKLLDQKGDLDSVYGRIAVGIFLVQDLVVVIALTILSGLARGGGIEGLELPEILAGVATSFGGMAILLVLAAGAARWVLPKLFGWVASSPETLFIWSLTWCFLFVLGAEALHISVEIGAFLAGISLAQLPYNHDLRRRVHPLMNFFIAVFFVALGVKMEFGAVGEIWLPVILLSLFVLIGNPFIFLLIISKMGYGERTSFFTSVTVAQISEFSFIFAALGLSSGLIGAEILSLVGIVGLITIAVSAYMILYSAPLYEWIRARGWLRPFRAVENGIEAEEEARAGALHGSRSGHVLVVGMNPLGRRIVQTLAARDVAVVAIDTDPLKLEGLGVPTVLGSAEYPSVLEEAGFEDAALVISALRIEEANRLLAWRAREAGIPTAIHAFDADMARDLRALDVSFLVDSREEGLIRVAEILEDAGALQP